MKTEDIVYQDEAFFAYRGMSSKDGLKVHVRSRDMLTHVGTLPYDSTAEHAKSIVQAYMRATQIGFEVGRASAQLEMRKALGLKEQS